MTYIKNYKLFESEENDFIKNFPSKEDLEEIETLFLDIVDNFYFEYKIYSDKYYIPNEKFIYGKIGKLVNGVVLDTTIYTSKPNIGLRGYLKEFENRIERSFPGSILNYYIFGTRCSISDVINYTMLKKLDLKIKISYS